MPRYLFAVSFLAALAEATFAADLPEPTDADRAAARAAVAGVTDRHLLKPTFDAELIGKGLDRYLEVLDSHKYYFTADDIRGFDRRRADLAKGFKDGDIKLAYDIYRRYQQRTREYVKEAVRQADAGKIDFSADESLVVHVAAKDWPTDTTTLADRVRLDLKYRLLNAKAEDGTAFDLATACRRQSLQWQRFLRGVEDATVPVVTGYFLNSVFGQLDHNTSYLPPARAKDENVRTRGSFFGVGAVLRAEDEGLTVVEVIADGPAGKDGRLKAGDRIVDVGQGESGPTTDVRLYTVEKAIGLITGDEGTTVRLAVLSKGEKEPRVIALRRGRVQRDEANIRDAVFAAGTGPRERKVGYIALPSLYSDGKSGRGATADIRQRLAGFAEKKVDVVVLDLRGNTGGPLNEATGLTGLFVTRGPVMQVRDRNGTSVTRNEADKTAWEKPLVVLTNRDTASGAEIVAAAVQDYARGLIIGDDATYGMGTVANLRPTDGGGTLQVTNAQFYRPNGESVQRRGVQPDIVLPSLTGIYEPAAIGGKIHFDRIPAVARTNQEMLDPATLKAVAARSAARRSSVTEFGKLEVAAEKLLGRKRRVVAPLNEEKFLAAWKANRLDLPAEVKPGERDFYLDEVLAIAADYAFQLKDRTATVAPAPVAVAPPKPADPPVAVKPPVNPPVNPPMPPAQPMPNPAAVRAAQRQSVQLQILETERAIDRAKADIEALGRQIASLQTEIDKGTNLMKGASAAERVTIGLINIQYINQKSDLVQKKSFAQSGLVGSENRLYSLKQDLIRLQD